MTRFLSLFIWSFGVASGQSIEFTAVPQGVVERRLDAYVTKNNERAPAVRAIFEDAGCRGESLIEQSVKGLRAPNLICNLTGERKFAIIVGAHFDLEEVGHGVVDNWTGASLLPSLYQGLADEPRRHTFRFVAFTGEEKGLIGSKAYVKEIGKTHDPVIAMVNLDTFGLAETEVWKSHADPKLVQLLGRAAAIVKLPLSAMNAEQVGNTDSESFREQKIPAITIHSLTSSTLPIIHSSKDRIEAVKKDAYYRTYRLVLAFLALLDQTLD